MQLLLFNYASVSFLLQIGGSKHSQLSRWRKQGVVEQHKERVTSQHLFSILPDRDRTEKMRLFITKC